MSRFDLIRRLDMVQAVPTVASKQPERDALQADIDAFLAAGGEITTLDPMQRSTEVDAMFMATGVRATDSARARGGSSGNGAAIHVNRARK